jgi:hypothetical protein
MFTVAACSMPVPCDNIQWKPKTRRWLGNFPEMHTRNPARRRRRGIERPSSSGLSAESVDWRRFVFGPRLHDPAAVAARLRQALATLMDQCLMLPAPFFYALLAELEAKTFARSGHRLALTSHWLSRINSSKVRSCRSPIACAAKSC